jgi:hypothetical protein
MHRRAWLTETLAVSFLGAHRARGTQVEPKSGQPASAEPAGKGQTPATPNDKDAAKKRTIEQSEQEVIKFAEKQGLKKFRAMRSKHYIAIGSAPGDYLRITLIDCETVALDFMDHFRKKGFQLTFPDDPMVAVVLADEREFSKFLSKPPSVVGLYWHNTNWLILQDFRNVPRFSRRGGVTNLRVLAHEATHQLTFNTGLLRRLGDTPSCIAEGLGAYGEVRRPNVRSEPGQINRTKLDDLAHMRRALGWIPLDKLITDDVPRRTSTVGEMTLFYAQGWLLVHYLMNNETRLPQFRKYLKTIYKRTDSKMRLDDARDCWGDLDKLDRELKLYSVQLLTQT